MKKLKTYDSNYKKILESGDRVKLIDSHEAIMIYEIFIGEMPKFTDALIKEENGKLIVSQEGFEDLDLDLFSTCECHGSALELIS